MKLKTKVFTLSSILLLAGVLSACSPSSDKETATTANSTTSSNSTHTVTDTLGHKVEIQTYNGRRTCKGTADTIYPKPTGRDDL